MASHWQTIAGAMERWEAQRAARGARERGKKVRIVRREKLFNESTAHEYEGPSVTRSEEKPLYLVQVRETCLCYID